MGRGKPLSELELERIKILTAQGMNDTKISEKIHRSRTLVRNAQENFKKDVALTKKAFEEEDIDDYNEIINSGLSRLKVAVIEDQMSAVALAKVVGIIFDKRQLVKGAPTAIEESNVTQNESGEAQSLIAAIAEFTDQFSSTVSETGSRTAPDVVRIDIPSSPSDDSDE